MAEKTGAVSEATHTPLTSVVPSPQDVSEPQPGDSDAINAAAPVFSIHVGDTKSGGSECSDAMLQAAIAAAGERIHHGEIMAAIYDAMFRRGGTYPGFVPLVRSSANLLEEHGTWGDISLAAGDLLFLEMSGCARRYHAPMGRVVHIGDVPASAGRALEVCAEAQTAAFDALRPGVLAGDVYAAWQGVLDGRGLASYRRHHCGYAVGIGYPPSWSGGKRSCM